MSTYKYASGHSRRDSKRKFRRRQEHMIYLRLEAMRRGCEISKQKLPPEELEWHHPDPTTKKRPLAKAISLGHEGFLSELAKCVCISRTLHRRLHRPGVGAADGHTSIPYLNHPTSPVATGQPSETSPRPGR